MSPPKRKTPFMLFLSCAVITAALADSSTTQAPAYGVESEGAGLWSPAPLRQSVEQIQDTLREVRSAAFTPSPSVTAVSLLGTELKRLETGAGPLAKSDRHAIDELDLELTSIKTEIPTFETISFSTLQPIHATLNIGTPPDRALTKKIAPPPARRRARARTTKGFSNAAKSFGQYGAPINATPHDARLRSGEIIFMAQAQAQPPAAPAVDPLDQLVVLDFKEMELSAIVALLAQQAQINVVAGTDVSGVVTANLHNVPLRQAIETVLHMQGLGIIEEEGIYRIVPYEDAVAARRKQRIVYLDNAQALEVRGTLEEVVASSPDAALISIAANDSTNVIIISGPEKAVDDLYDLALKLDITEPSLPTQTKAIKLNYTDPSTLLPVVSALITQDLGQVTADVRGRFLIVTDMPIVVEAVENLIKQIDIPVKQVSIDAMIVDALMSDDAETGLDWILRAVRRTNRRGQPVGNLQSLTLETDASGGSVTPGFISQIPQTATLAFQILSGDIDFRAVIAAQVQDDNAELLANPVIVTVENSTARISIAEEIPFQELTQTTTGPPIATTEFKEVGTVLSVTPKVTHDNHIIVELEAKQSDTKGESVTGVPPEDKREIQTTLILKDGQTIFIGGLRRLDDEKSVRKVPILGDIPILSLLFRRTIVKKKIVELLIFLTCNVLGEEMPDLTPSQQKHFDRLDAKPLVPDAQREVLRDYRKSGEMRDPFWKWRRSK